jgi:MoxR-like ATPase
MDLITLRKSLETQYYVFDEEFLMTVYIALKLEKPLLIEGPAGVGKTEVAKALAAAFNVELIRLQCYEGLDESKALYEWNYQKQLIGIQLDSEKNRRNDPDNKAENGKDQKMTGLFSEEFLLERPLLKAIKSNNKNVLLIDEIDKTDEEFEAFLLEILSDYQVSIPELGTIYAKTKPIVILTSNNSRQLSDALKRRCVYLYLDYPPVEKEVRIIKGKIPNAGEKLAEEVAEAIAFIRENGRIRKKPSISEALDWVAALFALDKKELDQDGIEKTIGFVLKNREDIIEFQKGGGAVELIRRKHS